jgi:hypothetical protein
VIGRQNSQRALSSQQEITASAPVRQSIANMRELAAVLSR